MGYGTRPNPVSGNWTSRWFEPSIAIGAGSSVKRQFFDRRARGDRYLLLTPGDARPGQQVRLEGAHLRWAAQTGELLLFRNPSPATGRVLVLAPHPDDAEIAAFGLYSTTDSFVVTMTPGNYVDGSYAHIHADASFQDTLKADVRTWDSLVVPSWGGVTPDRTANLGYLGLTLKTLYDERNAATPHRTPADPRFGHYRQGAIRTLLQDRPSSPTWASLVEDLSTLVDTVRPAIVVAPHPALDIMGDHQFTTVALLEALQRADADDVTLFLYTNHHVFAEYYPFGPADASVTMPPWFDEALPFTSVYSHPLDEADQLKKLSALDAMHDLRPAPRRLIGGPTDRFLLRLGRSISDLVRDPVSDYSHYRRAVRPNELFFEYRPEDRAALFTFAALRGNDVPEPPASQDAVAVAVPEAYVQ